jgi:hypothetical protein
MRRTAVFAVLSLLCTLAVRAGEADDRAEQLERSGDVAGARLVLARAAQATPTDIKTLTAYAAFLERYGDPEARTVYHQALTQCTRSADRGCSADVARRLVVLDLLAGDRSAASGDLDAYHAAGGTEWKSGIPSPKTAEEDAKTIEIPGPMRSFSRMAAISPDIRPEEILPALARNVVTNGYQASHSNDALEQTEYLKLVHRYLTQARELDKLAATGKVIKIETCESPQTDELLRILGFRMRGGCGSEVVLETVNAARAFLSTDSGFPLAELESALRENRVFTYDFHPSKVPVLYGPDYWLSAKEKSAEFIDAFLSDPSICRFYLGMSKLDPETAASLRREIPAMRLRTFAHVLDFFGSQFEIRNGHAVVPGGQRSAAAWGDLAGVSPEKGSTFFDKLMVKDDGWLASLYDALARIHGPVQTYLTEPNRMKRFYAAVRGKVTSPGPARPVFRSNADMMLLTTRLRIDPNGQVHIPGNLDIWKNLFVNHPQGKYDGKLTKSAAGWKEPDDLLEALFGLSRKAVENEPLKIFMAINDVDRDRPSPLTAATVDRLARSYKEFGAQFSLFSDAPQLTDAGMNQFLDTAVATDHIRDMALKQDTAGTLQALAGIWQIYTRQGAIPADRSDAAFKGFLKPFAAIHNDVELFDAGRSGIKVLLDAASGGGADPADEQGRVLQLLAGSTGTNDSEAEAQVVHELQRVLDAQHIIALDTLFQLADNLESVAKGGKLNAQLAARLASRISEISLPRAPLSSAEKNAMAFGYWTDRHIDAERKLNLRAAIDKAANNPEKLKEIRGSLAPHLRDTLVAFNYATYAPPGAQILTTNPVFVRGHDFLGMQGANHTWKSCEMLGSGWPSNAGGRLMGSLAGLPYALAEAEQNFLIPTQTQALIWGDLVPQMILSAVIPRWWNVTPAQVHLVGLRTRHAQNMLAESVLDPAIRKQILAVLDLHASPYRSHVVNTALESGDLKAALDSLTPAELYDIGADVPANGSDPVSKELRAMLDQHDPAFSDRAISYAFGTPKPTLANSYRPQLLRIRTFPTLMGYSSRIMAESWESNSLYWVALADQMHIAPPQLNVLIPEWTQQVVERIFASHLEDWPALLKSLRSVGQEVIEKNSPAAAGEQKAAFLN